MNDRHRVLLRGGLVYISSPPPFPLPVTKNGSGVFGLLTLVASGRRAVPTRRTNIHHYPGFSIFFSSFWSEDLSRHDSQNTLPLFIR